MNTKHTPAPWMVSENHLQDAENYQYSILSMANGASSVCDVWRRNFIKVGKGKFKDKNTLHECKVAEANAKLIAAAPELLKFIEKHYQFLNLDAQKEAVILIKKATE